VKYEAPRPPRQDGAGTVGLPGEEVSFILCPFLPAGRQGLHLPCSGEAGHVPVDLSSDKSLKSQHNTKKLKPPAFSGSIVISLNNLAVGQNCRKIDKNRPYVAPN